MKPHNTHLFDMYSIATMAHCEPYDFHAIHKFIDSWIVAVYGEYDHKMIVE